MTPAQNRAVVGELRTLVAQEILTAEQFTRIAERYPTGRWDLIALVRWFTLLGALSMGVGLVMLAPKLVDVRLLVDAGLGLAAGGFPVAGRYLGRSRSLVRTGATLELLGAFALQGLVTAWVVQHPTGSDNWPALVGLCGLLTLGLAYGLGNRLILTLALINVFTFLGGETGYATGWEMTWLGLDYPSRFVVAGLLALGLAYAHARFMHGERQGFSRVYAHLGLLTVNGAFWLLALFGFATGSDPFSWSGGNGGERLVFSVVWAVLSVGSILGGARYGFKLARAYGLTFVIADLYTFYFQFLVVHSVEVWYLHLLIAGGSLVALGLYLERSRTAEKSAARAQAPAPLE